jgi:cytochrome d ubiquinol oxidase subunit I
VITIGSAEPAFTGSLGVMYAKVLWSLIGTWDTWHELVHMYLAGYMVAGFLVGGAYAIGRWRGRWDRYHRIALAVPLTAAAVAAPVHLLGWYTSGHVEYGIEIPRLLSLLAFHNVNASVTGLNSVPAYDVPPVNVVRIAFQLMAGIGTLLALLSLTFLIVRWRRGRLPRTPWFYRALALAGPASVVPLIAGWVTTEVGRQPESCTA